MNFSIIKDRRSKPQPQHYKTKLIEVGNLVRDSYISRKSEARFKREVLQGLERGQLDKYWLWSQFKILEEESLNNGSTFNAQQTWITLNPDNESLFLLRLLWTELTFINK